MENGRYPLNLVGAAAAGAANKRVMRQARLALTLQRLLALRLFDADPMRLRRYTKDVWILALDGNSRQGTTLGFGNPAGVLTER